MTGSYWLLIGVLAGAAFSIRVFGLFAGDSIRKSRHAWMLDDLPGLIIVCLIASSLAGQPMETWIAAAIAFAVAVLTNHVILTMCAGVVTYAGLVWFAL
mgnify:CR=1 FL=1